MSNRRNDRRLHRRERAAAEALINDQTLREELEDNQAEQLLAWGFGVLERRVAAAAELNDEATAEAMRPVLSAVKAVMRLVNRLVAQMPQTETDDEAAHLLALFLNALQPLQTIPSETRETIPDLVGFRQQLGPTGTFDRLLAILTTTPDNLLTN